MKFENVTLDAKANIYFEGKVTSRTFYMPNGERKTLGFMLPGEYEFGTGAAEHMEVVNGSIDAKLPGETEFTTYSEGMSFDIPADSSYVAVVNTYADYVCAYMDEKGHK